MCVSEYEGSADVMFVVEMAGCLGDGGWVGEWLGLSFEWKKKHMYFFGVGRVRTHDLT